MPTHHPLAAPPSYLAFISLGASLGTHTEQYHRLTTARAQIHTPHQHQYVLAYSALYANPPAGGVAKHNFLNGVCAIQTKRPPTALLSYLLDLESSLGRIRTSATQAGDDRHIDLDILLVLARQEPSHLAKLTCIETASAELTLPHPRLTIRPFMWWPLLEVIASSPLNPYAPQLSNLVQKLPHQSDWDQLGDPQEWFQQKWSWPYTEIIDR